MMGNGRTATRPSARQSPATSEEKKLIGVEFINFIQIDNQAAQFGGSLIDELALKIAKAEHVRKPYTFKY